jgi:hypothetical protein
VTSVNAVANARLALNRALDAVAAARACTLKATITEASVIELHACVVELRARAKTAEYACNALLEAIADAGRMSESGFPVRKHKIKIGDVYLAKVNGQLMVVRIDAKHEHHERWDATNLATQRKVDIGTAVRLDPWHTLETTLASAGLIETHQEPSS